MSDWGDEDWEPKELTEEEKRYSTCVGMCKQLINDDYMCIFCIFMIGKTSNVRKPFKKC